MEPWKNEDDIFDSLQRSRAMDDLFGQSSGRGILGDAAADRQLAQDIANGMNVRDTLERSRPPSPSRWPSGSRGPWCRRSGSGSPRPRSG